MGLLDAYGDVMQKLGDSMQTVDPVGPMGMAGEMVSGLFGTTDLISERRHDALWNLAGDTAEVASVALVLLPAAKQTDIIAAGLRTVLGMQYQCGWINEPTEADGYSESAKRFNDISDTLKSARPEDRWTGSASDAYSHANDLQHNRVKMLVDADLDVRMALTAESGEVNNTRRILNNAAMLMGNAIAPALAARVIPKVGKALSLEIEAAVVAVSLPTCIWYMNQLADHSTRAAESIRNAVRLYEEVADSCYPTRM